MVIFPARLLGENIKYIATYGYSGRCLDDVNHSICVCVFFLASILNDASKEVLDSIHSILPHQQCETTQCPAEGQKR